MYRIVSTIGRCIWNEIDHLCMIRIIGANNEKTGVMGDYGTNYLE